VQVPWGRKIAENPSPRVGGYETHMVDVSDELVSNGLREIEERLERYFVSKGTLTVEEREATLGQNKM